MNDHDMLHSLLIKEITDLYNKVMEARKRAICAVSTIETFRKFTIFLMPEGTIIKQSSRKSAPIGADGREPLVVLQYSKDSRNIWRSARVSPEKLSALACPPQSVLQSRIWVWLALGNYKNAGHSLDYTPLMRIRNIRSPDERRYVVDRDLLHSRAKATAIREITKSRGMPLNKSKAQKIILHGLH